MFIRAGKTERILDVRLETAVNSFFAGEIYCKAVVLRVCAVASPPQASDWNMFIKSSFDFIFFNAT